MGTTTSLPLLMPLLTPKSMTPMFCAFVTPVRLTVIVVVPLPLVPLIDPVPLKEAALKVTGSGKVRTTL